MSQSKERVYFNKHRDNLIHFSRTHLKIKAADSRVIPLTLNKAQEYLHKFIEDLQSKHGMVRLLIVKARKLGCSTYVAARFYHKTTMFTNKSAYIMAHDVPTSSELFNMVNYFYDHTTPAFRHEKEVSNKKELKFAGIDGRYTVGTAGSGDIGRGFTIQYLHGSETAFWPHAEDIRGGLINAVPNQRDTEIILESTANGMNGMFYEMVMQAIAGKGKYHVVFLPWFWHEDYHDSVLEGFQLTGEEQELKELHQLTNTQIVWRRNKIEELGSIWLFKQEFPSNIQEAFQASGNPFISNEVIMKARKSRYLDKYAPLIITCDPSGDGGNRTVIGFRRGKELVRYYSWDQLGQMETVGKLAQYINKYQPDAVFIDRGYGLGIIDRLHELGFRQVIGVDFGGKPLKDIYLNKRAEMIFETRGWLEEGGSIPDNDEIHADLACMPQEKLTSSGKFKFPPKKEIMEEFGKSPDIFDMLALSFAFPVYPKKRLEERYQKRFETKGGMVMAEKKRGQKKNKEFLTTYRGLR